MTPGLTLPLNRPAGALSASDWRGGPAHPLALGCVSARVSGVQTMADRTIANPQRGCGTLKRGKAYIRGVIGSPDGVLPSFVELDPPIPYREMGTDGSFTRGFQKFDGVTAQFALDDITDFVRRYPGDATDDSAVTNLVDLGLYDTRSDVPAFEGQRHVDRIRAAGVDGDHFGEITAAQQTDLLMRAGKTHYPDPDDFVDEAIEHGISKAIPLSQNQVPPTIAPGITRCWILHPDTDEDGWAIIGYAYLQEVVYTEPADGNVPQYVQDFASAGRLDVVDIEDPDDSGPNAQVDDFLDDSDLDPDQEPSDPWDADPDDPLVDPDEPEPPDMVVPDTSDSDQDVRSATMDDFGYNDLKAVAAEAGVDAGQHPPKTDLVDALAESGITPAEANRILNDTDDEDDD